jgi:hypothetical protein
VSGAGTDDPGHDHQERGTSPDPAAWGAQGFSLAQARAFWRWRFTVEQAVAWRQAGVPDGLHAAQWATAGATPGTVGDWRAAGIDASQAVHWHEMGFDLTAARDAVRRGLTPDSAFAQSSRAGPSAIARAIWSARASPARPGGNLRLIEQLMSEGIPPDLVRGYADKDWDPPEALPWARAGIDGSDARLWQALGLSPAEAARLERKGATPADTMRDWWQAGLPFNEVADWIGAGLTAQEAADQRARGITAEQAAALRALRDQEEDDS